MVRSAGRYAVNVIGAAQQSLYDCFAHAPVSPGREDFCGASWHPVPTGLPPVDDYRAPFRCTALERVEIEVDPPDLSPASVAAAAEAEADDAIASQ